MASCATRSPRKPAWPRIRRCRGSAPPPGISSLDHEGDCVNSKRDSGTPPPFLTSHSWSPEKAWHEECGVFAAIGVPNAAEVTGLGLHALQHRGQEAAGIVSSDAAGEFHAHKGIGL